MLKKIWRAIVAWWKFDWNEEMFEKPMRDFENQMKDPAQAKEIMEAWNRMQQARCPCCHHKRKL